ncbi:uncharacterized protein LOC113542712 [Pangasianodon hypophthalmus]|uniref:uncharacterized protein LOC113542712 n=1 Tax=Pangasianodon hypophthalmus TaxID=310915 RepID=UPI002307CA91|nr:uncharacterized protein LOC113542712 [Pangasianodon hypophthalmus]
MLQFETLLLRQLQKQQNRDEFCDTVLQTQGVSVPVHSCVLSAFSPRLYGTLSSMPVPMAGQRRLIELQAVDACTLLSLVSLLYSGQLHENREQVLSAAQTLGIVLPQWQEERHGGKVGRRKKREDSEQEIEKEVDAREWDDRLTGRMDEGSGGQKEKIRESGTQTECGRETDERGAQTDLACSEPQSIQTIYLIDQSICSTNQELGSYMDIHDTALALQAIHPERKSSTCDVLAVASETGDCHTVSESACVSQIYLYSLETSYHQPSTSVTLHPHNGFLDQSMVVPAAGADAINDLKQFEGNIPGFISHFLDSTDSQNIGRMGQGCAREGAKEEQVVKRARARSTGGGSVREWVRWIGGGRGGRRQRRMERWGLVARLAWRGQGGGRVGRLLETRSTGKNPMRTFQRRRGREAFVEAGEARGRGRHREKGKTGTIAGSEEQNDPPRKRRPRGRPRVRPLPPASRSFSTMTSTKQDTLDPTELDLLHTVTPTPAVQMEPIQPIDTLLDDIMTGLHFLPPAENQTNQHGLMNTTTSRGPPISKAMYPNSQSVKSTDPKQHLEGEISDILDHFLRTFEQQVGCCGLDAGDETSQDKLDAGSGESDPSTDPWSSTPKTYSQLQPHNPHLHHQKPQANVLHTSSTLSTQPPFTYRVNPSVAEKTNAQDGQIHGSEMEKPSTDQNIVQQFENRRLTRSQSMKRKLETALISLQNPDKRKCKEKQSADTKKKRQRDDRGRSEACANKSGVNNLNKNNKNRATRARIDERQKQASATERRHGVNRSGRRKKSVENRSHKMDVFYERKKSPQEGRPGINGCGETKKNVGKGYVEAERISNGQSSEKSQIGGTCFEIASSAMEKVRMLLQLQGEEEDEIANESVGIHGENKVGNGRLVNHKSISGAEERLAVENGLHGHLGEIQEPEDEGRIIVNGEGEGQERISSIVEVSQRQEEEERMAIGLRQEELMTEECSVPFQLNLPSNAVFSAKEGNNNNETTLNTTESVTNVLDSWPGDVVSALRVHLLQREVVPPSTQSTMHKTADLTLDVGDAPRLTSTAQLSHTQPCQERLSPHMSTKDLLQLAGSSVDEEEDVDVLEVSSPTSELPAVPTVFLGVDLSTEEEEVDEDVEIDVLGLQSD